MSAPRAMRWIAHGRIHLALHQLAGGTGPGLLAVHALHGSSDDWGDSLSSWKGEVHALDLCGHGGSDALRGGGAFPELLAGDVDVAVAETGARVLVGRGLGAYLALLVAGARPEAIDAALLLPGPGLDGGGTRPSFERLAERFAEALRGDADPAVRDRRFLDADIRPEAYARSFAERARRLLLAEDGTTPPPWWVALRAQTTVHVLEDVPLGAALARLA